MAKTTEPTKVAVDTCLLLDMFLDELPLFAERTERVFTDPHYHVYLPTMVGVETIAAKSMRLEQDSPPISNKHIDQARAFLNTATVFWVELDEWAMELAQKLGPERLIAPQDAAILACAIAAECEYLFTKDIPLIKRSDGLEGITVCLPPELGPTQTTLELG